MPFTMTTMTTFELPWRIAFLPDGRMLVTEKIGPIWLVSAKGEKIAVVGGTPAGVLAGPERHVRTSSSRRLTPPTRMSISRIPSQVTMAADSALARARLNAHRQHRPDWKNSPVLWHQMPKGKGGQEGAQIAFAPDGKSLFLTVGDRQRFTPAQDPNQPVGKILHLTLDGKPAPDNPNAGKTGARTIPLIDPPSDTEAAKTAKVVSTYTFPAENLTPAETWASGLRTPYGLAFSPTGELWEVEHGPRGGDELNLIEKGKNYGWPLVEYADNYNGVPIPQPRHAARLGQAGDLLDAGDCAGQSHVLPRYARPSRNGMGTASSAAWGPLRSTASSLTAMAAPKWPSAGRSATGSAMWKKAPMARCGCWKTPIPAP